MLSLLVDFINFVSQMDDIRDVSTRTVCGKVPFNAGGGRRVV